MAGVPNRKNELAKWIEDEIAKGCIKHYDYCEFQN
jgi:hypothetical protein